MGARGPVPKPASERQNKIKRPEIGLLEAPPRGRDGKVVPFAPRPPKGLGVAARKRWAAFWHSPVAQTVDLNADLHRLERWIRATEEWDTAAAVLRKQRITRGSAGQPVLNPLASYVANLEQEISKAETALGLNPAARLRLGIAYGEARLTALELNRQLDEAAKREDAAASVEEADDAEWEDV